MLIARSLNDPFGCQILQKSFANKRKKFVQTKIYIHFKEALGLMKDMKEQTKQMMRMKSGRLLKK